MSFDQVYSQITDLCQQGLFNEAEQLATNFADPEYSLLLSSVVYRLMGDVHSAHYYSSLASTYQQRDKKMVDILLEYAYVIWRNDSFYEALERLEMANELLSEQVMDPSFYDTRLAMILHLQGNIYFSLGEYLRSISYHLASLDLYKKCGINNKIALLHNNLGYSYTIVGKLEKGMENLQTSLEYADLQNEMDLARTYTNLGRAATMLSDTKAARLYFSRALVMHAKKSHPDNIAYTILEYIKLLVTIGETNMAKTYLQKLDDIKKDENTLAFMNRYWLAKGIVIYQEERFKAKVEAYQYFKNITDGNFHYYDYHLQAIKYMCMILLEELISYNNEETLVELIQLLDKLQDYGKENNLFYLLIEVYIIEAKVQIIANNLARARKMIANAQRISDKTSFPIPASFFEVMLEELDYFSKIWTEETTIWQRISDSSIVEFIKDIQLRNLNQVAPISRELPVMLLMLDHSGMALLQYRFDDAVSNDMLVGSFITAINLFFSDIFGGETLERIKSKDFTVIVKKSIIEEKNYLFCYIYSGESHVVVSRLNAFIEEIQQCIEIAHVRNSLLPTLTNDNMPQKIKELIGDVFAYPK